MDSCSIITDERSPTIGVSHKKFTALDAQNVVCLAICGTFDAPPNSPQNQDLQCTTPVIGRYVSFGIENK